MLEQSKIDLATASTRLTQVAEVIAHRCLVSELEQNLIPFNEAMQTIDARRAQTDEIWSRTVHGVLQGLMAAEDQGFYVTAMHPRQEVMDTEVSKSANSAVPEDTLHDDFLRDPGAVASDA